MELVNVVTKMSRSIKNLQNHVLPADRSACTSMQSDQSLLGALWVAKDPKRLHADGSDWSDCGGRRDMSHDMTKPTKWVCAQRRLRSAWASAQSDQSSLCAQWVAKDPSFLYADSEDSDQTGRTGHFVGFVMSQLIYVSFCVIVQLANLIKGT